MKLPISWATKTPIRSSELSTTGKELRPRNGACCKGSLGRGHMRKLAQCDAQFRLNEGFTLRRRVELGLCTNCARMTCFEPNGVSF